MFESNSTDKRKQRTRVAIVDAFRALVFQGGYDQLRVADIIKVANIGRATFYSHFRNKDDLLLTVIDPMFRVLASAATGNIDTNQLKFMLSHFWDQKTLARVLLAGDKFAILSRKLAGLIEARLDGIESQPRNRIRAIGLATSQLAVIRAWLAGDVSCDVDTLARYLLSRSQTSYFE
jgi:AcrR family transcriptional regulator